MGLRLHTTNNPGPAAHPAKNATAGPGLPSNPEKATRRSPIVGANATAEHAELAGVSTVLSELTCLALHRPGLGAAVAEIAAYYDELAVVHEHLAATAASIEDRECELALADRAHTHADVLRTAWGEW